MQSTNTIPHTTLRLPNTADPGRRGLRRTTGSSGSTRAHNSSSISHGPATVFHISTGSPPSASTNENWHPITPQGPEPSSCPES